MNLPALLLLILFTFLLKSIYSIIWVPLKIQHQFRRQGVRGPTYRPIFGNIRDIQRMVGEAQAKRTTLCHDITHRLIPFYYEWSETYGKTFLYWFGTRPRLAISEPDMVKEVLLNTSGSFDKIDANPLSRILIGEGSGGLKGQKWAIHRKITNQAFPMEKVKGWVPGMVASTAKMLERWEEAGDGKEKFELEVCKELHTLTADIISITAFGSSFEEGKHIFELQEQLMYLSSLAMKTLYIPGFRFLPTKKNRERWRLDKEICETIRRIISSISDGTSENSKNLLGLLLSANGKAVGNEKLGMRYIIDECKQFYFAGKETSANLLTWSLLLLALHQEWQSKAREELRHVCKNNELPTADHINDIKLIGMILYETMRLYPLALTLTRQATKETKLGRYNIPVNTQVFCPAMAIHRDTELWGEDANEFNPMRFNERRGKHLASYMPFGLGPRICVGQNLAMVETKTVLAMIVQRFSFEVSPTYVHAPVQVLTLQPQYGAQIVFHKL